VRSASLVKPAHLCPGALLLLYFAVFGAAASRRAFWFDEIFTAYLAALPSASELLRSLWAGADLAPPLFHLVTRFFSMLPCDRHLALRLPELLGFGVMCACVFVFVNRRCGWACGLAAMLAPFTALCVRYAIDARPYGLVLGCFGAALVCWQSAAAGRRRSIAIPGLALAVAVAVSLHYYAILILVPIGAGELVRLVRDRRPDIAVWAAVAAGMLPLPAHLPFIRLSRPYMHNAWAAPSMQALGAGVTLVISPLVIGCFVVALAAALLRFRRRKAGCAAGVPAHEWAAAASLAVLPLFVYAVAVAFTGIFVPRYALGGAIGVAILLGFLLHEVPGPKPILTGSVIAALCLGFAANGATLLAAQQPDIALPAILSRNLPGGVVISGDAFRFLEMSYYRPSAQTRYIADPAEARRRTGSDSPDLGLLALRPWARLNVEDYAAFERRREPFLLYWHPDRFSWLLPKLIESGASIHLVAEGKDDRLYSVRWR
jgi:hypothetical protein